MYRDMQGTIPSHPLRLLVHIIPGWNDASSRRGGGGVMNLVGVFTDQLCWFSLYFVKYVGIHCVVSFVE